jgi:thioredoxin-like negative regulator of GroEL
MLYLVLADALFSTGDYHYGAYALRRGLELDSTLLDKTIDKHSFYADPLEFERQLAVLETYLKDRPTDHDARLLLAANYLFGNRPAAAVDLLESAAGTAVRESPAGKLVLASAQKLQYGAKKD